MFQETLAHWKLVVYKLHQNQHRVYLYAPIKFDFHLHFHYAVALACFKSLCTYIDTPPPLEPVL